MGHTIYYSTPLEELSSMLAKLYPDLYWLKSYDFMKIVKVKGLPYKTKLENFLAFFGHIINSIDAAR